VNPKEEREERKVKALERIADALERLTVPWFYINGGDVRPIVPPIVPPPVDEGPTPDVPPYPGEVVIYGCQPSGPTVPVPGGCWYTSTGAAVPPSETRP
jgi:hypothetical protein